MEGAFQLLKTAGALALVLGLLFGVVYAFRRWGSFVKRPASQPMMEVLSKQSFGPRHHLILVELSGGRKVLAGIAPQSISLLPVDAPGNDGRESRVAGHESKTVGCHIPEQAISRR